MLRQINSLVRDFTRIRMCFVVALSPLFSSLPKTTIYERFRLYNSDNNSPLSGRLVTGRMESIRSFNRHPAGRYRTGTKSAIRQSPIGPGHTLGMSPVLNHHGVFVPATAGLVTNDRTACTEEFSGFSFSARSTTTAVELDIDRVLKTCARRKWSGVRYDN